MASKSKFEDMDLSKDEIKRIGEAMKNEEFRKLLCEYAEEISDPENKKRYEEEIREMEQNRGMDIQFVHPEAGYVMKTVVDGSLTGKAFINIAKNNLIGKPSMEKKMGPNGQSGMAWQLPHSLAPPREDVDKQTNKCHVFDFVIHPDTYRMAETNARFKKMIEDTAFEAIEKSFNVQFDKKNVKYPKVTYKGNPQATVIRSKKGEGDSSEKDPTDPLSEFPYPYDNKTTEEKSKEVEEQAKKREEERKKAESKTKKSVAKTENEFTEPKYSIKHRNELDMSDFRNAPDARTSTRPTQLVVEIELPLCKSAANVNLDIFEKRLILEYSKTAKYKLDVKLPFPVDENEGSAKFDKGKKTLVVTLPVIPDTMPKLPFTGELVQEDEAPHEEDTLSTENTANGLIEVLSSEEFAEKQNAPGEVISKKNNELPSGQPSPAKTKNGPQKAEYTVESKPAAAVKKSFNPDICYILPEINYSQDHETASFILDVKNAKRDKVHVEHTDTTCDVRLTSIGAGGFPINYRLYLEFHKNCTFEQNNVQTDVSEDNVVLLLEKCDDSIGLWDTFRSGKDEKSTEVSADITFSHDVYIHVHARLLVVPNGADRRSGRLVHSCAL